eukprot:TRINITY_DN435_c0_g1_i1.p1 TRINITY_DN435_c0_g1~~TRINITY_DN435_c0_g1_i1.p1  ORF type:complete len:315 (-),score=118.52 TRINITY_DN435_c0_g1_i1:273-1187(-)
MSALHRLACALLLCLASAHAVDFLLLHGAFQGGQTWEGFEDGGVIESLQERGYSARAPTLRGNNDDDSDAERAAVVYQDYVDQIEALLDDEDEPAIVVAHSSTGVLVQELLARGNAHIRAAVFVNAWAVPADTSQGDLIPPEVWEAFQAGAAARADNSVEVDAAFLANVLIPGNTQQERDQVESILVPQPIAMFDHRLSPADIDAFQATASAVPRWVVIADEDLSGDYLALAAFVEPYTLLSVPGGHQFFNFNPDALGDHLDAIYKQLETPSSLSSSDSSPAPVLSASLSLLLAALLAVLCYLA